MNFSFWNGKTVFLTGHTGFKGGWMAHWLNELGASVHGYSLEPPTQPNFFAVTKLEKRLTSSVIGDILDLPTLTTALKKAKPDIIIHMAAQPLVRKSYKTPVETFSTNVLGTINILEAARQVSAAKAMLIITSDKCYENKEWFWAYRENDNLGGHDPYSASKACAEIVTSAYYNSFFVKAGVHLATARAGNVIGGGDWASDRLIPDFLRAMDRGETLKIRSPDAVRSWQHVLEPLSGYLLLLEKLYSNGKSFAESWNFGPRDENAKTVKWVVEKLCEQLPDLHWELDNNTLLHEARLLKLDSSKANFRLGWSPRWNLETTLLKIAQWHQSWLDNDDMVAVLNEQIQSYSTK